MPRSLTNISRSEANEVAELFKVLSDPTRVLIVHALIDAGECCVNELAERVGISPSSTSHHLRVLRQAGLVRYQRRGREIFYAPDDEHVEDLLNVSTEHTRHQSG